MQKEQTQAVQNTVQLITTKLKQIQIKNLHPPYFPKHLTKYREQYYESLKKNLKLHLGTKKLAISGEDKLRICKTIKQFVDKFDDKYIDSYLEELRQPYIRKMFQENYGFDDVDFKQANTEFHLSNLLYNSESEIENALSQASEWLLQVELAQDLLSRVELYFEIKTPVVIEQLKKEGIEGSRGSWIDSFISGFQNISTFALRKGSRLVQANMLTAMAPAAAMISFAILGSTSTLPWKTDLNINSFLPALAVMVVPFVLDSMAEGIQKNKMYSILEKWAISFEKMSTSIRKYNEFLTEAINMVIDAKNQQRFDVQYTNLQKYVYQLNKNLRSIQEVNEVKLEQMRERTQAYFQQYIEIKEGDWTIVYPKGKEQQQPNNEEKKK